MSSEALGRKLATISLGDGLLGTFAWQNGVDRRKGIPTGLVIAHNNPAGRSTHCLTVLWALPPDANAEGAPLVTLASLKPLTIEDELCCAVCGLRGHITDDRWIHA